MSSGRCRLVIIGATSALAERCAREWLRQAPADVLLVGRDLYKLEGVAADLRVRSPASHIACKQLDFADPVQIEALAELACAGTPVDMVLIAHGSLPDQVACQGDLLAARDALHTNGVSPVLFAEAFVRHMVDAGRGTLGIIGSVAGDRGRKSNYVYGSAKGLVKRYAQGLQHRLSQSPVKVVLIEPGPTDTPMTAHLKQAGAKMANADDVARSICRGMVQGKPVVYAPAKWKLIMLIIQHLPRFVFNKMDI